MSNRRYELELSGGKEIRQTAKLLNVSSAKYGGDWHSTPMPTIMRNCFILLPGMVSFGLRAAFTR